MKYTIEGFSQEYALGLRKKVDIKDKQKEICIDCTDLVILRWFVDFYPNMKKITVDRREYAWLSYQKMLDDLPILNISRKACGERMQKLVEFGILDFYLLKEGGTFTLYTFGSNYINLVSNKAVTAQSAGATVQTTGGYRSNGNGAVVQTVDKDTSISDSSNRNSSKKESNRAQRETFDGLIDAYTENAELRRALRDYLQMRTAIKKPLTNRALELAFKKLDELARTNADKIAIVNQSIMNSWQGLFPLRNNQGTQRKNDGWDGFYKPAQNGPEESGDFLEMVFGKGVQ